MAHYEKWKEDNSERAIAVGCVGILSLLLFAAFVGTLFSFKTGAAATLMFLTTVCFVVFLSSRKDIRKEIKEALEKDEQETQLKDEEGGSPV